jgi:hypothetical protein
MSDDARKETAAACATREHSSPYVALADSMYRERVFRARGAPAEHKLLAGQRLFEAACEITLAGIRDQNPGATERQCREILRERLAWRRRREEAE